MNPSYLSYRKDGIALMVRTDLPLELEENYTNTLGYVYPDARFDTYQYTGENIGGLNGTVAKNGLQHIYSIVPREEINNNNRFDIHSLVQDLKNNKWYNISNEVPPGNMDSVQTKDLTVNQFFNENIKIDKFDIMKGDARINAGSFTHCLIQHFPLRLESPEPDPLEILSSARARSSVVLRLNSIYGPRPMQTMYIFSYVFDTCVLVKSPKQSWIKPEFILVGKKLKKDKLDTVMKIISDRPILWYALFKIPNEFKNKIKLFKDVVLGVSGYLIKTLDNMAMQNVQTQDINEVKRFRSLLTGTQMTNE